MSLHFPAQGKMPALIPQRTESLWYPFSIGVEQMHEELLEEEEHHAHVASEIRTSGSFIPLGMKRSYMQDAYQEADEEEGEEGEEEEIEDEGEDTPTEVLDRYESDEEDGQMHYGGSAQFGGDEEGDTEEEHEGDEGTRAAVYTTYEDEHEDDDFLSETFDHGRRRSSPTTESRIAENSGDGHDEGEYSRFLEDRDGIIMDSATDATVTTTAAFTASTTTTSTSATTAADDPFLQHHLRHGDERDEDDGGAHVYDLNVPSDLSVDLTQFSSTFRSVTAATAPATPATPLAAAAVTAVASRQEDSQTPYRRSHRSHQDYWSQQPLSPTAYSPTSSPNTISPAWRMNTPARTTPRVQQQQQHRQQRQHGSSRTTPGGSHVQIYEDPPEPEEDEEGGESFHSSPDDHHGHRYRL